MSRAIRTRHRPAPGRIHPQLVWAKLDALVAGAKLATKELWSLIVAVGRSNSARISCMENQVGLTDNIAGARAFISLASCGRSAVVPVIFSRNTFSHPAAFNWRTCPVSSGAAVETRAST
jgi:hypothetical protein